MRTLALVVLAGCGATQIGVANYEDPRTSDAPHRHNDDTITLPDDEAAVEPEHPMVQSVQERATAHVHTPKAVCSGVVIGPKQVLTAHQCLRDVSGVVAITDKDAWRVEIASTSLTWTARHVAFVVTPTCDWKTLDAAILVLDEPADWIVPLKPATAPAPGATVQAMGFGRCKNEHRPSAQRTGAVVERQSDALEVEIGLCKGDVGGGLVDTTGGLLAVVSHQDDPDNADRHTTTGFRIDTQPVRTLFATADTLAKTAAPKSAAAPACN
ncbi:MAG TPA: serine protease [Polyangiaceae bacterium]|jgi:hypothetical protein